MTKKPHHYTPVELKRINASLPKTMRHAEGYARTVHQYSAATAAPKRRAGQTPDQRQTPRTINNATSSDTYEGPELRRLCVRPGAYDAIDAPSLRNGQRHAPQAPFCSP